MITKEITLCGKPVTLGYCYATEIAYTDMTGEDIQDFIQETVTIVNAETPRMPNLKKTIYAILACLLAYYESKGEKSPFESKDLMTDLTPQELGIAIGTIIGLRTQFYHLPESEQKAAEREQTKTNGKGRKAKN